MLRATLAALFILAAAPALAQDVTDAPAPQDAPVVTDRTSPDYMRCRRIAVTGSLARKERVCKTNAQWERIARAGNETARDTIERSQSIMRAEGQ